MAMKREVVITGIGAMTPLGLDVPALRSALREGRTGIAPIRAFDTSRFPFKAAYEIKGFDPHHFGLQALDPFIQYAVTAAHEAIEDARFDCSSVDPYTIGISVSSSKGGVHTVDRFRERLLRNPSAILGARVYSSSVPNFAAQWIARRWKLQGAAKCYVAACATGTVAVIEGARMVADGMIDYCVAGASDASIVPVIMAGYHQMKVLDPEELRPFDKRRQGFMVGEGAGIVFLETLESAKARGAHIYGKILGHGYGNNATASTVRYDEREDSIARTLALSLQRAGISPGDLDYVNLHATGTRAGDLYETRQIKKAFGPAAYQIPMSSTKSMTGHMLGAGGAVEIIISLIAMQDSFLPPTATLEEPDTECDLDYVARCSRPAAVKTALSLSSGFGGHIAAIVLGQP